MRKEKRREFLTCAAAALAAPLDRLAGKRRASEEPILVGTLSLQAGGRDFSPMTRAERKAVPSACWQCVTRDAIIGYVEEGRVVKIEGHPDLPRTNGKLCARGQAGLNQVYNPDRLLYPLKRAGKRGEGKWTRISWDEALDLLVNGGTIAGRTVKGLKQLRDEGHPEKFMFHYGRMKASSSKIIKDYFLAAYGTKTIGNHTSICEAAKWVAHELTWGHDYDNWDFENTRFVLNFGSNVLETHTNHVPMAQRLVQALARGVKMVTFDVRLSNTAAKSNEWVPVWPGTDLAVVLAMCHVIMQEELYDRQFIDTYTNVSVEELKRHLIQYTPRWAEKLSGVPAAKIRSLAVEFARSKPALCISYRGAVMHYNGVETERAIMMLLAITGNIDCPGGRCLAVGASWKNSFPKPNTKARELEIINGSQQYAYPTHHVSHQVFDCINEGKHGRPEIYFIYCYNPVYANGNCAANIALMKDEKKLPFIVACDVALSESSELADLVLPDATYLERWDWEDMASANNIPEYYIRQPMHRPLGQARNFCDVVCELATRLGLSLPFRSAEEFVKDACEHTPGVREAGGFTYMKKHGVWYDEGLLQRDKLRVKRWLEDGVWDDAHGESGYFKHTRPVDIEKEKRSAAKDGEEIVLDEDTGVWFRRKSGDTASFRELDSKHAAAQYVGQQCKDGKVRYGFPPDKHLWKTGLFEIKSEALGNRGFPEMPSWMPIPEHQEMRPEQLVLTTYKVAVQTHSRTQNCKWLSELFHSNPAWLHPDTARELGISDGDLVTVSSEIGSIQVPVYLTPGIVPRVIAISHHLGHWAYGVYASGRKSFVYSPEPDSEYYLWWKDHGVRPNWVIPNQGDPISGTMRWMDTVVTVKRVSGPDSTEA